MTGPAVLWLLFISWVFHDLEELFLFAKFDYNQDNKIELASKKIPILKQLSKNIATDQKEINIAISIMGFLILTASAAGYFDPKGIGFLIYEVFLGGYFLHTFTHIGQSIVFRKYTPGVISAVLSVFPVSTFIYYKLFQFEMTTFLEVLVTALIGIIIFVPLGISVHLIAKFISR